MTHPTPTAIGVVAMALLTAGCSVNSAEPAGPTSVTTRVSTSAATTLVATTPIVTDGTLPAAEPRNVLLVILDDLGVDSAECYAGAGDVAVMPNLRALCDGGLVFDRVWSNPTCSPTRATMLTGKYGFRTGIGQPVSDTDVGLRSDELTLPMALATEGIRSANIGKWHLAGTDAQSAETHPNDAGYEHYAGSPAGGLPDYEQWRRVVDGSVRRETGYATTVAVSDALAWIDDQDGPWFTWVAFNAPHTPFHLPPRDLHSRDDLPGTTEDIEARPREYFEAMVEALDTEIGRLITSIDSADYNNTVVIVVGDNGTAPQVAPGSERGRSKGSIYEGGIHVPLIVSGPGVGAGRTDALVNLVDVFPTILELMGADPVADIDGLSFAHVLSGGQSSRTTLYSEVFGSTVLAGTAGSTVSDGRWKYIRFESGSDELYDLVDDPDERNNLIASAEESVTAALAELRSRLARIAG